MNVVRLRTLRRRAALKLLALPYVMGLAAMALWPEGQHILSPTIAGQIGAVLDASLEKVESFAAAMVGIALMFIGYLVGWAVNTAFLALSRNYGPSQAFQIVAKSQLPVSWQNEKANEIIATAEKQLSEQREFATKAGPLRFVVLRGGLIFGTLACALLHIVLNLLQSQPIVWTSLPWKWCLWVLLGIANAAWSWHEIARDTPPEA